jgi:hypothetical protein
MSELAAVLALAPRARRSGMLRRAPATQPRPNLPPGRRAGRLRAFLNRCDRP